MADSYSSRRQMLALATMGLLALITSLVVAPVVAFVTSPWRRKSALPQTGGDFADAGPLDALPSGQWKLISIEIVRQDGWSKSRESRSVWVNRMGAGDSEIVVLSPICTHLGCPITWSAAASQFRCPCHGGVFSPDGKEVGGPPPRGMDTLEFQVRDGRLWVRWQDFKISVPDRVPVQV
jgi:menaquinol-cytochrome c reductase iron-sulfur subunit